MFNIGIVGYWVPRCANLCDEDANCNSFEVADGNVEYLPVKFCHLLESCNHYSQTAATSPVSPDFDASLEGTDWYFKHHDIIPTGYERYTARRCDKSEQLDLGDLRGILTVQECANLCSTNDECRSFAYSNLFASTPNRCWLGTCGDFDSTGISANGDLAEAANPELVAIQVYGDNFDWFLKREGFQDDETECLFLTHNKAEVRRGFQGTFPLLVSGNFDRVSSPCPRCSGTLREFGWTTLYQGGTGGWVGYTHSNYYCSNAPSL